jgi:hypothetical protein
MFRSTLLLLAGLAMLVMTLSDGNRTLSTSETHAVYGGYPNINHPGTCCVDILHCSPPEYQCQHHFNDETSCTETGYVNIIEDHGNSDFCEGDDDPGDICLQSTEQHHCVSMHTCEYNLENGACTLTTAGYTYSDSPDVCNGPC